MQIDLRIFWSIKKLKKFQTNVMFVINIRKSTHIISKVTFRYPNFFQLSFKVKKFQLIFIDSFFFQ